MKDFFISFWLWLSCGHERTVFIRNVYFAEASEWRGMHLCTRCGCMRYTQPRPEAS